VLSRNVAAAVICLIFLKAFLVRELWEAAVQV